jgi:3-oxoacyl-[acyl-carrier protein] reductase
MATGKTTAAGVALVTGGSRGIGAAIAQRLAHDGFAVAVNYVANAAEAQALVATLEQAGARALAVQGDVAQAADARRIFDTVEQAFGKIDVLVNNAGVLRTQPIAETDDAWFERIVSINIGGVFNMLREAGQRLNDGGRIVNLSSTLVALNLPGYGIYSGTKAAVEAITRVFAKELRGRRITVNCVAPGPVATELFMHGKTAEQVEQYAKMPPLERLGQPDDVARVVSFLSGPDGAWVNGQVIRANGGLA